MDPDVTPPPPSKGPQVDEQASRAPWAKPTMRVLVAGWFGDLGQSPTFDADWYEGNPNYPPSAGGQYTNPPS